MKSSSRFVARVAILSALAYVAALASLYIPNVSLIFIVVFASGAVLGITTGLSVGALGMLLWTVFNPLGMASLPITIAQVTGMTCVGALGGVISQSRLMAAVSFVGFLIMIVMGLTSGLVFQIIMNGVSAWLYQPFWPSFVSGLLFSVATIISNAILYPICYPVLVRLATRERRY